MRIGLEATVLHLGAAVGGKAARRALREAQASCEQQEDVARRALFALGYDLVPTQYGPSDGRAPIIVFGDNIVLVERGDDVQFAELAAKAGRPDASALPAGFVVPRRPLQALAGRSPWRRLGALLEMERSELWTVFVYAGAIGLTTLATPIAVQTMFDIVAFGTLLQPLIVVAMILLAVLAFSGVLRVMEAIAVELIARRIFVRAATDFTHRIPLVDRNRMSAKELREKVTRFFDSAIAEKSAATVLLDGVTAVLQISVGLLLLAFYHPFLLAFDLALIVGIVLVVFPLGRHAVATAVLESKNKYKVAAWLQELASAPHAFGSATGLRHAEARADDLLANWLESRKDHFRIQLRQFGGMLALQIGASVGLLALGGALVIGGQLSLGQLVAAEVVMSVTVGSLAKIGKLFGKVYDLVAAVGKLGDVVDLPLRHDEGERVRRGSALSFGLEDTFEVTPNERVAVFGAPSQLLGLSDGVIVGGVRCTDLDPAGIREQVVVLCHDGIFEGDLLDNLAVADANVTHESAREALEAAGANDLARDIERAIGPQGAGLSPEQRTRLLVARALLRPSRVLILDHVFEELDESKAGTLVQQLFTLEDTTIVCLTERESIASLFDRSVRLDASVEAA